MLPDLQLATAVMDGLPRIIARAATSEHMLRMAQQVAPSNADVLIEGEQGTGKRLLARWIHRWSTRSGLPITEVDCEACTESELGSILFGGTGRFGSTGSPRLPQTGTLLLTEVGELPQRLQARLLCALDEHERQGSRSKSPRVRVIATTGRPLRDLVADKSFRADLYYRLKVVPITVPALRVRREDIPVLAEQFLGVYSMSPVAMTAQFVDGLLRHSWPGNVSELCNLMRRTAALCSTSEVGPEYLQFDEAAPLPLLPGISWRQAERQLLEATLAATQGNRTRAAEKLGLSVRTVRNKIRDFGLPPRGMA